MTESSRNPLVVLADDDPDDRLLLGEAFVEAGFDVRLETVADGEALLDFMHCRGAHAGRAKNDIPDLILCDINMPRLSGLEAVEALSGCDCFADVPVVMLTSSRREEDRRRSLTVGAQAHYVKPSSFREMVSMVRELMVRFAGIELDGARGRGPQ